jgi:hypothetical protein
MSATSAASLRSLFSARRLSPAALMLLVLIAFAVPVTATCPEEPPLQSYTGGGQTICPCFVEGEEAGAVLTAPAEHYPIEILRVGIGWGSQFGGTPQQQEAAVNVYAAGLPNPGTPIFSLPGPVLSDGYVNEFNLAPLPGEIIVNSGAFTVTLEFLYDNVGNIYAPSVVHDGNGCQGGKNVIFAIPGGWMDGCAALLTGDWVVYAVYRPVNCTTSTDEQILVSTSVPVLLAPQPNPFSGTTRIDFVLPAAGRVDLAVYDVAGRLVSSLVSETLGAGPHSASWDGVGANGRSAAAGTYFVRLNSGGRSETRRVLLLK